MKKNWPFLFSILMAMAIANYSKQSNENYANRAGPNWKTFVKNSESEISGHKTTRQELEAARVATPSRTIASVNNPNPNEENVNMAEQQKKITENHYLLREDRVLIGDIQNRNYQDENVPLLMLNKINPNWKEILGLDLLRFQTDDTKLMIKEEFSIIQIQEGNGRYYEQVIVTYLSKDGSISSFRALVDSETGSISQTWDKSVREDFHKKRANLSLPSENNSGIIVR